MDNNSTTELILITTIIFLIAPAFILAYILVYNRRKKHHIEEKEQLRSDFKQELLKTQIEVQEQTLVNISREIHDNITQVLSFVKLSLGMIKGADSTASAKINESRELVAQTINDLRYLSKSLSFERIVQQGLVKTIGAEVERINNSGLIKAEILVQGEPFNLGEQRELVLFRIFQEALNNTLKHSGAANLKIILQYAEQMFNLTLEDDGAGFSTTLHGDNIGAGLRNMNNRAALIGAVTSIDSSPGNGCCIKVTLDPYEQQLYDSAPTNRVS